MFSVHLQVLINRNWQRFIYLLLILVMPEEAMLPALTVVTSHRDLRQSSFKLARLVQTQQEIEKPSDGVVNFQQEHGFQLEQSDCLEVEDIDK